MNSAHGGESNNPDRRTKETRRKTPAGLVDPTGAGRTAGGPGSTVILLRSLTLGLDLVPQVVQGLVQLLVLVRLGVVLLGRRLGPPDHLQVPQVLEHVVPLVPRQLDREPLVGLDAPLLDAGVLVGRQLVDVPVARW